jgi:hypothetical protein
MACREQIASDTRSLRVFIPEPVGQEAITSSPFTPAGTQRGTTSLQLARKQRAEESTSQLVLVVSPVLALLCASASWREIPAL